MGERQICRGEGSEAWADTDDLLSPRARYLGLHRALQGWPRPSLSEALRRENTTPHLGRTIKFAGAQASWPRGRENERAGSAPLICHVEAWVWERHLPPLSPRFLQQVGDLNHPLTSCSTWENSPSSSHGQHSGIDPVDSHGQVRPEGVRGAKLILPPSVVGWWWGGRKDALPLSPTISSS